MNALSHPSPNFDARPAGTVIDTLVLHYTGMTSGLAALERLRDTAARVSSHWLIFEDGSALSLVAEANRAWHAGVSAWHGRSGLNDTSIGIEIVYRGHAHGLTPFDATQIAALIRLAAEICSRHAIMPHRVLAHSDIAPDRKLDPGECFPWHDLARAGLVPPLRLVAPRPPDLAAAKSLLAAIGYPLGDGMRGLRLALAAFQRRHRPQRVDGRLDAETMGALESNAAS